MIKIAENPKEGLEVQKKGEGLERKLCNDDLIEKGFFLLGRNGKYIPKHIEDILLEKGFERDESHHRNDLYKRQYNGVMDVFVYDKGYPEEDIKPEMTITRVSKWDMKMARIFKQDIVSYAIGKIMGYDEGKEVPLRFKLITPAIYLAPWVGMGVMFGTAFFGKNGVGQNNILLFVLSSFGAGGVIGTTVWRACWGIHNRQFKQGEKAIEYIQNGRISQEIYQAKPKAITQSSQPYSEEITV